MPDDESTTDEVCAFASLLSGPPSSPEEAETNVADVLPLAQNPAPTEEKSIMVCRHWRNKGWCRMEDKCKFLHPENKRGISAANVHRDADVSKHMDSAASGILPGHKKKRGAKSRSKKC